MPTDDPRFKARNFRETATLVVQDRRFDDWESVYVQHRFADGYPIFRFTAAERDDLYWLTQQFKPEDQCAIYLGGRLAINGIILTRQTAFDARSHAVQLSGVGMTWTANRSSIIDKDGNYDDLTFEQLAKKLYAPHGVEVKVVGKIDDKKIDANQVNVGASIWDNLEAIARSRGIIMGSDHEGRVLLIGQHSQPSSAVLIQGENIQRCQAIISIENSRYDYVVRGQSRGTDGHAFGAAAEMEAKVRGKMKHYSPILIPSAHPVWSLDELAKEAQNEAKWNEGTNIQVNISVYGWFAPNGDLWRAGDEVSVNSSMAMLGEGIGQLHSMRRVEDAPVEHVGGRTSDATAKRMLKYEWTTVKLKIETATFTQDSESGTLTTLGLKAPWALNGAPDWQVGPRLQPPSEAKPSTDPTSTPTTLKPGDPPPFVLPELGDRSQF